MSGDARITGRIHIDPPITWGELQTEPWAVGPWFWRWHPEPWPDAFVHIAINDVHTPEGLLQRRIGDAIEPTEAKTDANTLAADVDRIVQRFGFAPDGTSIRSFTGRLDVEWPGRGQMARIVIRDGKAVQVSPLVVWPDDARDPDEQAPDPGSP